MNEDNENTPNDLMTLREASALARRTTKTLKRWIKAGRLTRYEGALPDTGGPACILISRAEVDAITSKHKPRPGLPATIDTNPVGPLRPGAPILDAEAERIRADTERIRERNKGKRHEVSKLRERRKLKELEIRELELTTGRSVRADVTTAPDISSCTSGWLTKREMCLAMGLVTAGKGGARIPVLNKALTALNLYAVTSDGKQDSKATERLIGAAIAAGKARVFSKERKGLAGNIPYEVICYSPAVQKAARSWLISNDYLTQGDSTQ